jgi:hypothetical protein
VPSRNSFRRHLSACELPSRCRLASASFCNPPHKCRLCCRVVPRSCHMPTPDLPERDDLSQLERVLASSPRARSPLFRWLSDHFEEVSRLVRRYGRNWTAMAAGLNGMGVTRRNGAPVSADSLRKTWAEVCRIEAARRKEGVTSSNGKAIAGSGKSGDAAAAAPTDPEFAPARLRSGYRANDAAGPKGGDKSEGG